MSRTIQRVEGHFTENLEVRGNLGLALLGTAAVVLFLLALFVWPTQWRYFTLKVGTSEVPLRSHRLTDETQYLTLKGWVVQDKSAPSDLSVPEAFEDPQASPSTVQAGIEIQKRYVDNIGNIHISVYNGSGEKLSSLKIEVTRTDGGAPRLFDVITLVDPRESELVNFSSGLEDGQVGEVRLISVERPEQ